MEKSYNHLKHGERATVMLMMRKEESVRSVAILNNHNQLMLSTTPDEPSNQPPA